MATAPARDEASPRRLGVRWGYAPPASAWAFSIRLLLTLDRVPLAIDRLTESGRYP